MTTPDSQAARLPAWAIAQAFQELDDCGTHSSAECKVYNRIFNRALELSRSEKRFHSVESVAEHYKLKEPAHPRKHGAHIAETFPDGVVDEWRPIETAPRDGTKIIGCAIRQSGTPEHVGLYWASHPTQKRWTDGEWSVFLTHWIPAPPALAAALGRSNG
ncbi:hypothetical protein [Pseudoxanthomonas sp.]|uniref:hypothetical protein n=1 Tax=Pseudoxanthomonas sp. TaxID=1871049 RepID=UPI003F7FE820